MSVSTMKTAFVSRSKARAFVKDFGGKIIDMGSEFSGLDRWFVESEIETKTTVKPVEFAQTHNPKQTIKSFADLACLDIQTKENNTLSIGRKSSGAKLGFATQNRFNKVKQVSVLVKKSRKNVLTCAA